MIWLIQKLASLYLLKSAMDTEQARQILGLPPNASKSDVMFAYKKQMHKLYMQTGQYQKAPALDEARDSLMQEPATVVKPVDETVIKPQQSVVPQDNLRDFL